MEFSGDEKRIQALFSELSLEDQISAPRFEKLWSRAEAKHHSGAARHEICARRTVVIVVMGLVAARVVVQLVPVSTGGEHPSQSFPQPAGLAYSTVNSVSCFERACRASTKTGAPPNRSAAIQPAAMLSNWQSPTSILLNSPTVSVLSSLPQLDQSARDLEQFLPKK
jgi:hypothetical protein